MIRMATIGTSTITRTFIAETAEVPDLQVTTVYSRTPDRAESFAAENGIATWTSGPIGDLLASDEIDAVYIASPNALHHEHARAAIEAGKHVLVEKPATTTASEFADLATAARERRVVLLEGMRNVYDPGFGLIRDLLPRVGEVRRVSFGYHQRSARYDFVLAGTRVNIFDPAMGGGALRDLGVYVTAALVDLFGEPESVAAGSIPLPKAADGAGVALAFYEGFIADLSWSKISFSHRPSEIQGELGTLTVDHIATPRTIDLELLDGTHVRHELGLPHANLRYHAARFAHLVATGDDAAPDQGRTLRTLRTMDAFRAAAAD
jgi:predicted dehydrogenase